MQIAGPHLLASLKGINTGVEYGLIDGGATHFLRYGPPGEYKGARRVEVHLASGSTQELRMSPVGTLLSSDPSIQPILPMSLLASELKCDFHWVGSTCSIQHPEHGQLQVIVNRNCSEIQASMCLELISERRRAGAMMSAMREVKDHVVGSRGWKEMPEKDFLVAIRQWTRDEFSEVPVRIQERITPAKTHVASESGLNRHARRKLERGSAFLHLFAGVQLWDHPGQVPSLSIDLESGLDLHDDALYWYLLQLARHGDVSYLLAGPPCRTRSEGPEGDGGPRILRPRYGLGRFGLEGRTTQEQAQADGDTVLMLRTLVLAEVAAEGLKAKGIGSGVKSTKLFFGLEHLEDPAEFLDHPKV